LALALSCACCVCDVRRLYVGYVRVACVPVRVCCLCWMLCVLDAVCVRERIERMQREQGEWRENEKRVEREWKANGERMESE
jgi:hypothetical protein